MEEEGIELQSFSTNHQNYNLILAVCYEKIRISFMILIGLQIKHLLFQALLVRH